MKSHSPSALRFALAASLSLALFAACLPKKPLSSCESCAGCAAPVVAAPVAGGSGTLTILHTNDMHTRFLAEEASWFRTDPKPLVGGMVALKDRVDRERAAALERGDGALVVDAGDWLTGTPLSDIECEGARGGAFIEMMNAIGYDAATIGNHEFDNGLATIPKLIGIAGFDVVSANLLVDGQRLAPAPWKIVESGGLRVGVVGLILDDLAKEVAKSQMAGVTVAPVAETARAAIAELDPVTDLIVLLTHQGWEEDSLLATRAAGADVIVGGHSHTRIRHPRQVGDVLVVQAGSYVRELGRLQLTVADDRVQSWDGELISLMEDEIQAPDAELVALVDGYRARIDAEFAVVVSEATAPFGRDYYKESPLGDLLCDAVREIAGADVALLNSGGLRQDLAAGPVRKLDVKQILPFQNTIVAFDATGAQLLTFLATNAKSSAFEEHGILQMSGIACAFRVGDDGVELLESSLGGAPIDPERVYRVATVDYVHGLADKYLGFEPAAFETVGRSLYDDVVDWIAARPRLEPAAGARLVQRP